MTKKQKILNLVEKDPQMPTIEIARASGSTTAYVRKIAGSNESRGAINANTKKKEGKTFARAATETEYNSLVSIIDGGKIELKKQSDRNRLIPNETWKEFNQTIIAIMIASFREPEVRDQGFWFDLCSRSVRRVLAE